MSVVGFIVHEGRGAAVEAAAALGTALHDDGVEVVRARDAEETARPDLIVTVGGDGTFLRGAHVAAEQGVTHRRWTIPSDVPIGDWLADEPLLIADGHHRYTTALAYRDEMRATSGPGPWDRLLTFIVDAGSERLSVRPFHRIQTAGGAPEPGRAVSDLPDLLGALSDDDLRVGIVRSIGADVELTVKELHGEPPTVRALHDGFLDALATPGSLRFTPDPVEALAAVTNGEAVAAYLLPPTTPDRIRKVVERGERLPQKSTYFWPKPRTGVILMPLDALTP